VKRNTNNLAEASLKIPYNTNFTHPNLFRSDIEFDQSGIRILLKDKNLGRMLIGLWESLRAITGDPKSRIKRNASLWKEFVEDAQDKILLEADFKSSLSAWNDLKRHRTVRQRVESIYHAADRCIEGWDEDNFYSPNFENQEMRKSITELFKGSMELYRDMIEHGIEKRDAIYVIPNGMNVGVRMLLDGYNLFDPFGFIGIRACTTADHEITRFVNQVSQELKRDLPEAENLLGPKCKLGFCPEKNFCGVIKQFERNYDENMHSIFQ
jgi:hypothetical protein